MAKFSIVKGREFDCAFVIKQPNSPLPVDLVVGDSGTFTISTYGPDPEIVMVLPLTLGTPEDNANGKVFLEMRDDQTIKLESDVEFGEDGFPEHPTYKGLIDVTSAATGKIYAQVPKIYVVDIGE